MKIYVGADHRGFYLRNSIISYLKSAGYDVVDDGDAVLDPDDDSPKFAQKVAHDILGSEDNDARGILICGSGQAMCMSANRFKGIRAALGYNKESVRSSRNDDDSNVLCLPANELEKDETNVLIELWLNTPFAEAPRFKRRLREMDDL